ncbi:MAG: hypothetical protein J6S67_23560 [Methanobrevibacter sp.]|nr:hypothetical protein [Methanobrevibacter sp.]
MPEDATSVSKSGVANSIFSSVFIGKPGEQGAREYFRIYVGDQLVYSKTRPQNLLRDCYGVPIKDCNGDNITVTEEV